METFIHSFNKHEGAGHSASNISKSLPRKLGSSWGDTDTHSGKWEVVAGAKEKGKARWGEKPQGGCAPCVPGTARGPGQLGQGGRR